MLMGLFAVTTLSAQQTPLYLNLSNLSYGTLKPDADNDVAMDYNASTGMYEKVYEATKSPAVYVRFYTLSGTTMTQYAPATWTRLQLGNTPSRVELESGKTSVIQVTEFYGGATSGKVKISVNSSFTSATFEQVIDDDSYPDALWVWASNEGGGTSTTKPVLELKPSTEKYIYTGELEFTGWYLDPTNTNFENMLDGYAFYFRTSDTNDGQLIRAQLVGTGDNADFNLETGQTYTKGLTTKNDGCSSFVCTSPGKAEITVDYKAMSATIKMIERANDVHLNFEGNASADINRYLTITSGGKAEGISRESIDLWYYGNLDLVLTPTSGYSLTVEPASSNTAGYDINVDDNGKVTITSDKAGLTFNVTIDELTNVTFTFRGVTTLAELKQLLTIRQTVNDKTLDYEITGMQQLFGIAEGGSLVEFIPEDGYTVTVTCTTSQFEEVEGEFTIVQDGDKVNLNLYPGASGKTFQVRLTKKATQEPDDPNDNPDDPNENPDDPTDGVGSVNADGGEAAYYTLQGVKVANPERGLYIRVINGKAEKVVL